MNALSKRKSKIALIDAAAAELHRELRKIQYYVAVGKKDARTLIAYFRTRDKKRPEVPRRWRRWRVEVHEMNVPAPVTKQMQRVYTAAHFKNFLRELARHGRFTHAAQAADVSLSKIAQLRKHSSKFDRKCDEALMRHVDRIDAAVERRGLKGYEKSLTWQGKKTGDTVMKYDTKLLEMYAKRHDPGGYGKRDNKPAVQVNTGVMVIEKPQESIEDWILKHGKQKVLEVEVEKEDDESPSEAGTA